MATYKDIVRYYRQYWGISLLSIAAASLFEIIDLVVPYAIGQILNVLSRESLDAPLQAFIGQISAVTHLPLGRSLSLWTLLGMIFLVTVVRAPIQPWIGSWFHWAIPLRANSCEYWGFLLSLD